MTVVNAKGTARVKQRIAWNEGTGEPLYFTECVSLALYIVAIPRLTRERQSTVRPQNMSFLRAVRTSLDQGLVQESQFKRWQCYRKTANHLASLADRAD